MHFALIFLTCFSTLKIADEEDSISSEDEDSIVVLDKGAVAEERFSELDDSSIDEELSPPLITGAVPKDESSAQAMSKSERVAAAVRTFFI
jgi:hypothetical protein